MTQDTGEKSGNNRTALCVTTAAAAVGAAFAVNALLQKRREATWDLRDKVVLITGGPRGLGLVLAREFVDQGAKVVLCAREVQELERARLELVERGGSVLAVPCDVTRREEVLEAIRVTESVFGAVEVLVNNAGIIQGWPVRKRNVGRLR